MEAVLGRGGMGAVLAAVNLATGGACAIKWLLPEAAAGHDAIARFVQEAQATGRIEHPNVVGVLDAGADAGAPFLVMERLRGESLADRLARGRLSVRDAIDVGIAACRGLAEAHAEGVVHRDLKPANIFLCMGKDGSPRAPKVLDFGISKLLEHPHGAPLTQTGISMGTPHYMAPEQIDDPRGVDPRIDVYAMGVVLYEALTGRLPYDGDGIAVLAAKIASGRPAALRNLAPEVPPALEAVVMRAMHPKRDARPWSMRELARELEAVRASLGGAPAPRRSRTAIFVALAAFAALGIVAAGAIAIALIVLEPQDRAPGAPLLPSLPAPTVSGSAALRPQIDLRFAGACEHIRFDGRRVVRLGEPQYVEVAAYQNDRRLGWLVIRPGPLHALHGEMPVTAGYFVQLAAEFDGSSWANFQGNVMGTIEFARFEPGSGIIDVTFHGVTLHNYHQDNDCSVEGRVQTFGPTEG